MAPLPNRVPVSEDSETGFRPGSLPLMIAFVPTHVEDYRRDCGKLDIEAMVFLECYADFWEGGG